MAAYEGGHPVLDPGPRHGIAVAEPERAPIFETPAREVVHPPLRELSAVSEEGEGRGLLDIAERRGARLRARERTLLAAGIVASVGVHFALFAWSPSFHTEQLGTANRAIQTIQLPPDIKIPPPPQAVARPATPKVATADVSPELTIAPTTMEANPASALPPPPPNVKARPEDRPTFIPYDVAPELLNRDQIETLLVRYYPPDLRSASIGGSVIVWAYVNAQGKVTRALVKTTSGYPSMDAAALRVVNEMRFKPAQNRDRPIGVWISQKVSMSVRR